MGSNTIPDPDEFPQIAEALVAIRKLVRTLRTEAVATERSIGLSTAQLLVLQLLRESDANSINDLATQTMTDQSSVSAVVARLRERGFVSRAVAKEDARRTIVSITSAGEQILEGAPMTLQARLVSALRQMPPTALRGMTDQLAQLTALLGAGDELPNFLFEENDATGSH